jgi:hypothetical protein
VEFKDRFFGIYGREREGQQLFVEMSLLLPNPTRRLQLLQTAPNVSCRSRWAQHGLLLLARPARRSINRALTAAPLPPIMDAAIH